eukprot:g5327.t1
MDDSVDTFVKSLSFRSRSSLCESIETNSGSTDLVKQSNRSHTTCKMHHGVENGSADDHSDLHDWLLELEETICTNPNKVLLYDTVLELFHIKRALKSLIAFHAPHGKLIFLYCIFRNSNWPLTLRIRSGFLQVSMQKMNLKACINLLL